MEIKFQQTVPLAVTHAMDGTVITRTRLMKLCFLVESQLHDKHPEVADRIDLAYFPYDYGPYSTTLLGDVEHLDDHNALSIETPPSGNRYAYKMGEQTRTILVNLCDENDDVNAVVKTTEAVVDNFGDHRIRDLLDYVYQEYPEYHELTPFW